MKKNLFFTFAAALALVSCSEDPEPTKTVGDPSLYFVVNNKPTTVKWQANSDAVFPVRANVDWTPELVSGTGAALVINEDEDGNPTEIAVNFEENESEEPRKIKFTISTDADVATKSYGVTVTQNGQKIEVVADYVRVNESLEEWSGDYLLVFEGQIPGGGNTYQGSSVLIFNGSLQPTDATTVAPLDGPGNIIAFSSATSDATHADLATLTGATVERIPEGGPFTEITVSGGKITSNAAYDAARIVIAAVDGGYSIKTASGYFIGSNATPGAGGGLGVNMTFTSPAHVHNIEIGDSAVGAVTYHNCAIITSSGTEANNTVRVNGNTGRFGYWKNTGQQIVALYKRNTPIE